LVAHAEIVLQTGNMAQEYSDDLVLTRNNRIG
jgi:hypothetical protein